MEFLLLLLKYNKLLIYLFRSSVSVSRIIAVKWLLTLQGSEQCPILKFSSCQSSSGHQVSVSFPAAITLLFLLSYLSLDLSFQPLASSSFFSLSQQNNFLSNLTVFSSFLQSVMLALRKSYICALLINVNCIIWNSNQCYNLNENSEASLPAQVFCYSQRVADLETAGVFQGRKNKIVLGVPMLYVLLFLTKKLTTYHPLLKMLYSCFARDYVGRKGH